MCAWIHCATVSHAFRGRTSACSRSSPIVIQRRLASAQPRQPWRRLHPRISHHRPFSFGHSVRERKPLMTHLALCTLSAKLSNMSSSSRQAAKKTEARDMPVTCKYALPALLLSVLLTSQVICQTSPVDIDDCPHRHHKNRQASPKSGSAPSSRLHSTSVNPQQQLAEPHLARPMDRMTGVESGARQQRQYGYAKPARLVLDQQVVNADARLSSTPAEHEEFSLSLGAQVANSAGNTNNYTLVEPTTPSQPSTSVGSAQSAGDNIGLANTTPALPSDSIGSPVALQPPATTTSSIHLVNSRANGASLAPSSPAPTTEPAELGGSSTPQGQRRQAGEQADSQQLAVTSSLPESAASARAESDQFPRHSPGPAISNGAVSSSPSSISIITPLVNPAKQTHTSLSTSIGSGSSDSALMKPIFVLGNPISERDYTGPSPSGVAGVQQASTADIQTSPSAVAPTHADVTPAPQPRSPSARSDKTAELEEPQRTSENSTSNLAGAERMSGPPLIYSDGLLSTVMSPAELNTTLGQHSTANQNQQPPTPRLLHNGPNSGAAVLSSNPRRPSLPPPVNQANAASGFRSPMSPSGSLIGAAGTSANVASQQPQTSLLSPVNSAPSPYYQTASAPYAGVSSMFAGQTSMLSPPMSLAKNQLALPPVPQVIQQQPQAPPITGSHASRRPLNITRVERK